jgi:hypothetical protein
MRRTLYRIGLGTAALVATLSFSGIAAASPAAISGNVANSPPTTTTWVYINTYPHATCIQGMLYYNNQGYIAQCAVASSTHSHLYVWVV